MEVGPTCNQTTFHVLDFDFHIYASRPTMDPCHASSGRSNISSMHQLKHEGHTVTILGDSEPFAH
ncbi:hypothetical protein KI387_041081, partial [Taxus chinensis]